jgi:hypothetical protein
MFFLIIKLNNNNNITLTSKLISILTHLCSSINIESIINPLIKHTKQHHSKVHNNINILATHEGDMVVALVPIQEGDMVVALVSAALVSVVSVAAALVMVALVSAAPVAVVLVSVALVLAAPVPAAPVSAAPVA